MQNSYKAIIIGGGPAGLSSAVRIAKDNQDVLIIEREARLGGILKQCIHDGFGVIKFGEKLSGPEYAERYIDMVNTYKTITVKLLTFVINIERKTNKYIVTTTGRDGINIYESENVIFACGCRERTARQVGIHGTRPAGVMTAGVAQNFVNIQGVLPTKKCVILGSGDIGLIMARRLTLEGSEVIGVYEAKSAVGGLSRNVQQCLIDFNIPLHLSTTVTRVFGNERVEKVEVAKVDEKMNVIEGTQRIIECDAVILSVGLIPENELIEKLGVKMDKATKGPKVDQNMMTSCDGIFSVGNCLHVHDLVDYVSESAEIAGSYVVENAKKSRKMVKIETEGLLYLVPQYLDINSLKEETTLFFRSAKVINKCKLDIIVDGKSVFSKSYPFGVKPPEMEKVVCRLELKENSKIKVCLKEIK